MNEPQAPYYTVVVLVLRTSPAMESRNASLFEGESLQVVQVLLGVLVVMECPTHSSMVLCSKPQAEIQKKFERLKNTLSIRVIRECNADCHRF